MIAANAKPIIEARQRGMKPREMILVSLIGRLNEPNHTVYANAVKPYDWLWARGLEICIYATPEINWRDTVLAIAAARPSLLLLWDADRKQGADVYFLPRVDDLTKPKTDWRWDLSFLPWRKSQNEAFAWN